MRFKKNVIEEIAALSRQFSVLKGNKERETKDVDENK